MAGHLQSTSWSSYKKYLGLPLEFFAIFNLTLSMLCLENSLSWLKMCSGRDLATSSLHFPGIASPLIFSVVRLIRGDIFGAKILNEIFLDLKYN